MCLFFETIVAGPTGKVDFVKNDGLPQPSPDSAAHQIAVAELNYTLRGAELDVSADAPLYGTHRFR
jgi:hypothetical protein